MIRVGPMAERWFWLVQKDLQRELRAPRLWPGMLLLGLVLALVIALQFDLPRDQAQFAVGGMFWLAAFFAGTVHLERSLAGEQSDGCWQGLLLYPVTPGTIYLAKLAVNFLALCLLDVLLVPTFAVFSDVSLLARPWLLMGVLLVTNLAFAALGTLLGALSSGIWQRGGLLVLLLLPLVSPVVIAATEATRGILSGQLAEVWRWGQLLAVCAATFVILGTLTFEFVIED